MKTNECIFLSTQEQKNSPILAVNILVNTQFSSVSRSLLFCFFMLIDLRPTTNWLLLPLACLNWETSGVSNISANWLANITFCLRWEIRINCSTVVDSDQKLKICIFIPFCFTTCSFNFAAMAAVCNSASGVKRLLFGATAFCNYKD